MTIQDREFAKNRIEYLLKISNFALDKHDKEALELAIKALSQVSEIEENIIKYMKKYPNHVGNTDFWEGFYACRNVVLQLDDEEYLPKEQEPTDAISREAVFDAIEREDKDYKRLCKALDNENVLEQIRAEIEDCKQYQFETYGIQRYFKINDIWQIIDKYKGE